MGKEMLICPKCNLEIERAEDRWVHLEDWNRNKKVSELDMHLDCWKEKEKKAIQKAFEEKTKEISPMLGNIMKKFMGNGGGIEQNA